MNYILIIIILGTIFISKKGFSDTYFFKKYQFEIGKIKIGEFIRLFSSGFLHSDITHLAFNMLTLYFFAPVVYKYLGNFWFIIIYFLSLFLGNLLTLFFYKNQDNYTAVGASGAVVGILYSAILLEPNMILQLYFLIPIPAYIFGVLYLFYSIYGMKSKTDNIGHSAHFGGAIGGFLLTLCICPNLLFTNTLVVISITTIILVLFIFRNKLT